MLLFRSEEHVTTWLNQRRYQAGMTVSLETVWHLAKAWYADPRSPDWRARSLEESQRIVASTGLTESFWAFGAP